jgi:TPR repeat protein
MFMKKFLPLILFIVAVLISCSRSGDESKPDGLLEKVENLASIFKESHADIKYNLEQVDAVFSDGLYDEAYSMYQELAKAGDVQAMYKLGAMAADGIGMSANMQEALKWWQEAASNGSKVAQYNLGVLYSKGQEVNKDLKTSAEWFSASAKQGFAQAQYALGLMYLQGLGVKQDVNQGIEWLTRAAEQGDANAIAELENLNSSKKPPSPENLNVLQ